MYEIQINAYGNIDHGENPFALVCKPIKIRRKNIADLRYEFRQYILNNGLGASNICRVDVIDLKTHKVVGYISYNGRYWPLNENGEEIK